MTEDFILDVNGVKITWFKDFLDSGCNKVGIRISGGVDSTLILWMLCYFCDLSKRYDIEIYPYYGRDCSKLIASKVNAINGIIDMIKSSFPKVNIKPIMVSVYWSRNISGPRMNSDDLYPWAKEREEYLKLNYGVEWFINGRNVNLSKEEYLYLGIDSDLYMDRDEKRDPDRMLTGKDTFEDVEKKCPLYNCSKYTIKKIYEKYNLMETLYPKTSSCASVRKPYPCKKCLWCREKKAVFDTYDFGIL